MRDLRRAAEGNPTYPLVLFVSQASAEELGAIFADLWPEARAVADPDATLHRQFGIRRAGLAQSLTPGILACGVRAALKGNMQGRTQGDPRLMPGLFALADGRVVWHHDFRHHGDNPDFAAVPALIAAAAKV